MYVTGTSYAWFIFNLNTKSCYSKIIYYSVYTWDMAHVNPPSPCFLLPTLFSCHLFFLTWRTSFLARGANTHPLLSLVCYQLLTLCYSTHPDTPHRSSYNIYIDDINNISRPIWYSMHCWHCVTPPCWADTRAWRQEGENFLSSVLQVRQNQPWIMSSLIENWNYCITTWEWKFWLHNATARRGAGGPWEHSQSFPNQTWQEHAPTHCSVCYNHVSGDVWSCPCLFSTCSPSRRFLLHSLYLCIAQLIIIVSSKYCWPYFSADEK